MATKALALVPAYKCQMLREVTPHVAKAGAIQPNISTAQLTALLARQGAENQ